MWEYWEMSGIGVHDMKFHRINQGIIVLKKMKLFLYIFSTAIVCFTYVYII